MTATTPLGPKIGQELAANENLGRQFRPGNESATSNLRFVDPYDSYGGGVFRYPGSQNSLFHNSVRSFCDVTSLYQKNSAHVFGPGKCHFNAELQSTNDI